MYIIEPLKSIDSIIKIPPDKSISHRAVILSALCRQKTRIYPFLKSNDTLATIDCIERLGVRTYFADNSFFVNGQGLFFAKKDKVNLFAGDSGTTMRILSGLLCGQKFPSFFEAGTYLNKRPMGRIIRPLAEMGADIRGKKERSKCRRGQIYPPLIIKPVSGLAGKMHQLKIASAQVKSALLLAGLLAKGKTVIKEPCKSRDHSERMLQCFGADIRIKSNEITLDPGRKLKPPQEIFIPGDFSSAAFFIVLALILKESRLVLKNVSLNPSRCGLLNVLKRMGAGITIENLHQEAEPYADIIVKASRLEAAVVEPDQVPIMIDEIPVLCVAAAFAQGRTQIKGVKELTVKETDRVLSMVSNLKKAGVAIQKKTYGADDIQIIINGASTYKGAEFNSYGDHRTAMSMIVFASAADSQSKINDTGCIDKSFPGFISAIEAFK